MRSRLVGPGVGGLYYSPLLRSRHGAEGLAAGRLAVAERQSRGWPRRLRLAIAGAARGAAQRLVDARMAQAQQYVEQAVRVHRLNEQSAGRRAFVHYY